MKAKHYIVLIVFWVTLLSGSVPAAVAQTIVRKKELASDTVALSARIPSEKVIVNGDTVSMVIPQRNFGRYDRGLFNYLFIPKGEWAFGLTASYGELNTEDIQVLGILKDLDFKGKIYSIKPSVSYFVASNQSVGLKFNYSRGIGDLDNLGVDFSEDLNFSISDVSYYTQSYAISAFYRNYVGLGLDKRFAVFNEVDLAFSGGSSRFKRIYDGAPRDTRTIITEASLNFSPGLCVFIQDHVSFNISFGVFGLKLRKEHQTTDGVEEGSRFTSGANFRFNIFNIAFGLMVVI
ncbi:MAG: hypothetical protein K2P06_05150 [Muribaculaceae bacterium]|nr:hypothetical protein [Muribaculaceae bacterium]